MDRQLRHSYDVQCLMLDLNFELVHKQPTMVALLVGVRVFSNGHGLWTYERFVLLGLVHILKAY